MILVIQELTLPRRILEDKVTGRRAGPSAKSPCRRLPLPLRSVCVVLQPGGVERVFFPCRDPVMVALMVWTLRSKQFARPRPSQRCILCQVVFMVFFDRAPE